MQEKIFAIIVTYNGASWIRQCISSLLTDIPENQIIIVDNKSSDETVQIIRSTYPDVLLWPQSKNLGFGKANNLGLQYALENGGSYVLLLNQDAWLEQKCLENLKEALQKDSEIGLISPMHYQANTDRLDYLFQSYFDDQYSNQYPLAYVKFVNAAIWLVPIQTIEIIGGFDTLFPHYGEDSDFANRLVYHGLKLAIHQKAMAYHDRDSSAIPPIEKRKYFEYIQTLVRLKNINTFFILHYLGSLARHFKYFLSAMMKGKLREARLDIKHLAKILFSAFEIISHRNQCKMKGTTFISTPDNN